MPFKVGVTTGLYYIAHDVSLATTVKKIGYALTRGADVIEISGDTPHEISYTEGEEIRNLANNQGLDLLFHGSLTVPIEMPERTDWRDAQDHMEKSVRSAVHAGCTYVLFHACLHFWVELLTYTGTKLTITMCDHDGNFISEILYKNTKLRKWFVDNMRTLGDISYERFILSDEEFNDAVGRVHSQARMWEAEERQRRLKPYIDAANNAHAEFMKHQTRENAERAERAKKKYEEMAEKVNKEVAEKSGEEEAHMGRRRLDEAVREKLGRDKEEKRRWKIDNYGRLLDAYKIMAHHLFFTKDPQWVSMCEVYSDLMKEYKMDYTDDSWLINAWNTAEVHNDTIFKQFFYAAVGAKFLEGHLHKLLKWMDEVLIAKELKGKPELQEIARKLQITIEIPDARDPKYAGRYMLCHPKQIYSAIKTIRKVLKTDRIWMTIDNEHLATQGYDPVVEMEEMARRYPDFGRVVISNHVSHPTPLHSHYPVELGDTVVYTLLYYLRKAGGGKDPKHRVYLIFERGGGDEPFRQSVDALKLMAKFLDKDPPTPPEELPLEFYGLEKTAFDVKRQEQIMMDHRFDVLKDLFEVPEEEWGLLSTAAVKKGRKEIFKKEELQ